MENRYPFAFTTAEIDCVMEALQTQISVLQTYPPNTWRYSLLSVLTSVVERLQLLEPVQDEEMIQIGRD